MLKRSAVILINGSGGGHVHVFCGACVCGVSHAHTPRARAFRRKPVVRYTPGAARKPGHIGLVHKPQRLPEAESLHSHLPIPEPVRAWQQITSIKRLWLVGAFSWLNDLVNSTVSKAAVPITVPQLSNSKILTFLIYRSGEFLDVGFGNIRVFLFVSGEILCRVVVVIIVDDYIYLVVERITAITGRKVLGHDPLPRFRIPIFIFLRVVIRFEIRKIIVAKHAIGLRINECAINVFNRSRLCACR